MPYSLKGLRQECICTLKAGKNTYKGCGEVQFNDYGLSGIPVMELSRFMPESGIKAYITLDLLPQKSEKEIYEFLLSHRFNLPSGDVLCGLLPRKAANYVLLLCEIKKDELFSAVSSEKALQISKSIKNLKFTVSAPREHQYAQVSRGGVSLDEINPETMEAKKHPGLYVIGEALNVDGPCGGFNLSWAWSSARTAADSIIKAIEH